MQIEENAAEDVTRVILANKADYVGEDRVRRVRLGALPLRRSAFALTTVRSSLALPPASASLDEQQVSVAMGRELAAQYKCEMFETSAKNNSGVEEAFHTMARLVVQRLAQTEHIEYGDGAGIDMHDEHDDPFGESKSCAC